MKFETDEDHMKITEWFKHNKCTAYDNAFQSGEVISIRSNEDRRNLAKFKLNHVAFERKMDTDSWFNCPVDQNAWEGVPRARFTDYLILGCDHIPNVKVLDFMEIVVGGFKHASKLTCVEEINFGHAVNAAGQDINLLQLFKMPMLNNIGVNVNMKDRLLYRALMIVKTYITNSVTDPEWRDIVQCQSALIDAGLERFAHL